MLEALGKHMHIREPLAVRHVKGFAVGQTLANHRQRIHMLEVPICHCASAEENY